MMSTLMLLVGCAVVQTGEVVSEGPGSPAAAAAACRDREDVVACYEYGVLPTTTGVFALTTACQAGYKDSCALLLARYEAEDDFAWAVRTAGRACVDHGQLCEVPRAYAKTHPGTPSLKFWLSKLDEAGR